MKTSISKHFSSLEGRLGGVLLFIIIAALTALGTAFGLTSCNVTRTVTTKSEYRQQGDTSVFIQTRTVESYDASKKL